MSAAFSSLLMPILPLAMERFLIFFLFFGDAMQSERKHSSMDTVMFSESF